MKPRLDYDNPAVAESIVYLGMKAEGDCDGEPLPDHPYGNPEAGGQHDPEPAEGHLEEVRLDRRSPSSGEHDDRGPGVGSIADVTQPIPALDFSAFDTDVRVQDDLFRHVNGAWIERTPIPDDKPLTGVVHGRCGTPPRRRSATSSPGWTGSGRAGRQRRGQDRRPVRQLHGRRRDRGRRRAAAAASCSPRIDAVTEVPELIELMGALARVGVRGLVGVDTESDPGDPEPVRDVRRPERTRTARRGVLPGGRVRRDPRGLPGPHRADARDRRGRLPGDRRRSGSSSWRPTSRRCHWDKVKTRDLRLMYNLMSLTDFSAASAGPALADASWPGPTSTSDTWPSWSWSSRPSSPRSPLC